MHYMKPVIIYCYDAYCGWCYGFSPVIRKIADEYKDQFQFEVFSGGMILPEEPKHISVTASYINEAYKKVEELAGVKFGEDYLWHIKNPSESDWYPDSLKPAIALCIFKEYYPERQVLFAYELQQALHAEGRDLCDNEAYRHLLIKYNIPENSFYEKLKDPKYEQDARYEFAIVKQLKVTGFPTMFLQTSETKFYLLSRGYSDYDTMKKTIESVLKELNDASENKTGI